MHHVLPLGLCSVFVTLALWHFWMSRSGAPSDQSGAVPSVDGRPLFVPSTRSTVAIGVLLLLCAVLVAATADIIDLSLPESLLDGLSCALALGLLARAIGDFRYVGFFKRVRDTPFARMDTLLYSPLCLALAAGMVAVALRPDA